MFSARRTNEDKHLVNVLRETARFLKDGKLIDIAALSRVIESQRAQRPQMCATLTDMIQAAQQDATRGNRDSALEHFRGRLNWPRTHRGQKGC